jgi:hypothetical protein
MLQVSGLPAKTLHAPIKPKDGVRAAASDNERQSVKQQDCADVNLDDLVFRVAAAFRGHPHLNNVLTHISGANWNAVEKALHVILDPREGSHDLSPLARNIVDLMCADRGVTGRILKPFYRERLVTLLGDRVASRLIAHVTSLFLESEAAVRTVKKATPTDAPTDANERPSNG